ncbi:MAG: Mrp/NBP35 family ATP-binding protein [Thermoplasmata archaeon]|nr:Mrp/NBP35 family ATP-binding protein [Thermoplasmata archaeon]
MAGEAPDADRGRPTSTPPNSPTRRGPPGSVLQRMEKAGIGRVIAIASGKGGVGKSSTTALIASELRRRGLKVGVLDADVTGPSQPKMFGVRGPLVDRGEGIEPATTSNGIAIVSSQFMVEDEQTPVIWRGPLVTRLIMQFFGGVNWGKLDYLLVDMPPGTSDVPLTVFQSLPLDGIVFVFTPQDLSALIVKKAMNMARDLHVPLLGVVENLAFFTCPHCGERSDVFGQSHVAEIAQEYGVPLLARLPIDPKLSPLADVGGIGSYTTPELTQLTDALLSALKDADSSQLTVL